MAERLSIADSVRRDAERRSARSASGEQTRPCELCGGPVEVGVSSNPRRRHEECRRAAYFLAAAVRALRGLDERAQAAARRHLIAAANALPTNWQRPRDERGHFVAGGNRG